MSSPGGLGISATYEDDTFDNESDEESSDTENQHDDSLLARTLRQSEDKHRDFEKSSGDLASTKLEEHRKDVTQTSLSGSLGPRDATLGLSARVQPSGGIEVLGQTVFRSDARWS